MMPEVVEDDGLEPYVVAFDGRCWVCGSTDLSHEHKFKLSDLRRIEDDEQLVWGTDGEMRSIRSLRKSDLTRFPKILCRKCNNQRSQPYDYAYDMFGDYIAANTRELWSTKTIEWAEVYGENWEDQLVNLKRYCAKYAGCRLVEAQFPVPQSLVTYVKGGEQPADIQFAVVRNQGWYQMQQASSENGALLPFPNTSKIYGQVSKSRKVPTELFSYYLIGSIGFFWLWKENATDMLDIMTQPTEPIQEISIKVEVVNPPHV